MDTVQKTEEQYLNEILRENASLLKKKTCDTKAMYEFCEFLLTDRAFGGNPQIREHLRGLNSTDITTCLDTIRLAMRAFFFNLEATARDRESHPQPYQKTAEFQQLAREKKLLKRENEQLQRENQQLHLENDALKKGTRRR